MACFLVPTGEAIVATIVKKGIQSKEDPAEVEQLESEGKIPWSRKLSWPILLCLEHMWHGEVVLWPPFLTAMADPADTAEMLAEMGSVGVGMAVFVTVAWIVMVLVADNVPAIRSKLVGEAA